MLLAVDIGNTNLHAGLFDVDSGRLVRHHTVSASGINAGSVSIDPAILEEISDCILASVNPVTENNFLKWFDSRSDKKPLKIPDDVPIRIPTLTRHPERIGVDRLLNATAAYRRTRTSTIVVDVGTAITVDAISANGEFLGGVISPGLEPLKTALHACTALLPEVQVQRPHRTLGRDTHEAVNAGLYWGMVGVIERITNNLSEELDGKAVVLATGGDAELLANDIQVVNEIVPHLTLEGVFAAYVERAGGGVV